MTGVMDGDMLNITANAQGTGTFSLEGLPLTADVKLDGLMDGSLEKIKE